MGIRKSRKLFDLLCFAAFISLVFAVSAQARQRGDLVPGSRYLSGRAAAMGDAFLPLADDGASGLFYNPAGIARLRATQFEPMNLQFAANSDYISMFNRNFYNAYSLEAFRPEIGARNSMFPGIGAAMLPNFFMRGFAAGILMQSRVSANSSDGQSIRYRSLYQLVPAVGFGLRLASGVARFGYSLQWVNQASGDVTVPMEERPLGYNQKLAQGSGLSHNVAFALTLPVTYLPSFNIVARNVLGVRYSAYTLYSVAQNSTGTPPDEEMTFDLSASIQPKIASGAYMNLVLEYRDATARSGMFFLGRAVAGGEFSFRDQFFLRGGWGSGYLCAGLGIRRKTAELSLAWYAEEFGDAYHVQQDRRYLLHYQVRAF